MNDSGPVKVVLVGIAGMGYYYLDSLLNEFSSKEIKIVAGVDPHPENSTLFPELKNNKIPVYPTLKECFRKSEVPELTIISSPIQYHVDQCCEALGRGSHVLCEKPLGATVQEAKRLIKAKNESNNWVMIGYQWSFSEAIQALKKDILKGDFGEPVRMKTICFWHRDLAYYKRNNWAGKIKDKEDRFVLDSPANNAMAHFLHNLFYLLGDSIESSAFPAEITAEAYKAYPIENFDTAICRAFTDKKVEILFYASHVAHRDAGPDFCLEFEKAIVRYSETKGIIMATDFRGKNKIYGSPGIYPLQKIFYAVESVRKDRSILCGPEAAMAQTLCVNGIQESISNIKNFPEALLKPIGKNGIFVNGLYNELLGCYKNSVLPSESACSWARKGKRIDLTGYNSYPNVRSDEFKEDKKDEVASSRK